MNLAVCLSTVLLGLIAGTALAAGSNPTVDLTASPEKNGDVLLSYTAPLRRVVLTRDLRLVDSEDFAEYANPVAAEPTATKVVKREGKVSEREAVEMLNLIRKTGFFDLKAVYGGSPQERSYPYIIVILDQDTEKKVAYYSRPDAEPRPAAFAETEQKILEFAQRKAVELNSGGK